MDITNINSATQQFSDERRAQIQKVARDFESIFTSMMIKSMRGTIGDNPLIPQSFGEKIFTDMLDDEYSKMMSSKGLSGLSRMIEKELLKQESIPDVNSTLSGSALKNTWMLDKSFIPSGQSQYQQYSLKGNLTDRVGKWDALINKASEKFNIDKQLLSAVIAQESAGNQFAVSKAGAKGLMQLMDSTAAELGVSNPFSPEMNIMGGAAYLRFLLDKYNGNEDLALASYNAGPSAVDKYKGIPPYAETQNYVKSIQKLKSFFTDNQEL